MSEALPNMHYMLVSACALMLVLRVRPIRVTHEHQVEEAPVHFVAMPDALHSSRSAVATLDPRVDPEVDQQPVMVEPRPDVVAPPRAATAPEAAEAAEKEAKAEGATRV